MNYSLHIREAIDLAGGPVATARLTGAKSYQAVQKWIEAGQVPARYCCALETVSGVSRKLLNRDWADIWPEFKEIEHA